MNITLFNIFLLFNFNSVGVSNGRFAVKCISTKFVLFQCLANILASFHGQNSAYFPFSWSSEIKEITIKVSKSCHNFVKTDWKLYQVVARQMPHIINYLRWYGPKTSTEKNHHFTPAFEDFTSLEIKSHKGSIGELFISC